ncbi:MAG: hypothetical protein ACXWWN_10880, partial [Gemmatimonadales bacterium]
MTQYRTRLTLLAAAVTAFAALGCEGEISSGAGLADGLTGDVGIAFRDEVETAVGSLTPGSALDPIGTTQAAGTATSLKAVPCVSPSAPADNDGDGVPDDAIYLFTAPPCRFTGWHGGTLDIVGQLRIQDPAPSSAGFGYEATITGLRARFTSGDGKLIYDVTRNGTRSLSGSTAGLLLTTEVQIIRTFAGHPDAAIDKQWVVNYTPAAPLLINQPIPSGSLDIAGTADWTRGEEQFALVITTPTPLQYDAACTDTVQRIKAGELHAAGTFDGMQGFVRVRWTKCGEEPRFT